MNTTIAHNILTDMVVTTIQNMITTLELSPNALREMTIDISLPPSGVTLLRLTINALMPSFNIVELNERKITFNIRNKTIKHT